jgi:hypothetical protein
MSCFYLIASLPALALLQKPLITPEAFHGVCREQLRLRDSLAAGWLCSHDVITGSASAPPHPFIRDWQARETRLRNAVVRQRAGRRKAEFSGSLRPQTGYSVYLEEMVERAFDQPTPLVREQALDRLRWELLDELAGLDPFAVSVVLAYAAKLRMVQRWATLDEETARQRVEDSLQTVNRDTLDQERPPN